MVPVVPAMVETTRELGCSTAAVGVVASLGASSYSFGEITGPLIGTTLVSFVGFPMTVTLMGCFIVVLGVSYYAIWQGGICMQKLTAFRP